MLTIADRYVCLCFDLPIISIFLQGFTVDPTHSFLFVAGADCRIRGWSLRTGDPIVSAPTLFQTEFTEPVPTLQVIEDVQGLSLYAGSLSTVYKCRLSQCHDLTPPGVQ